MRIFTLLIAFVFCSTLLAEAQTMPVLPLDFESATTAYNFNDFDGGALTKIANPQSSNINTSANVAKMVKSAGNTWGGSYVTLADPIDFSTNKTFKVKVFMPRVGAKLLLKVENLTVATINYEKEATSTVANVWEELTFNFSTINTTNSYQKVIFIFDNGMMGDGSANFTYLLDDVRLISGSPTLTQMNLPVTFDDATVDYGLIGFGGADASTIVADPTNPTNKTAKVIKSATAETWAGTTVTNSSETGFSSKIPFTATDKKMSVRIWSPHTGIKVRLKVEDATDKTKSVETEATSTIANNWETLIFDFANQATGTEAINLAYNYNKASIFFNFGVTGATAGEKIYYFDDMKFGECINLAKPTITPTGLNTETVTLTSSATTGNQWYLNGNAISNATNKIYNPTVAGTYKVQVNVNNCYSPFSNDVSLVVTGDLSSAVRVAVYPNPTDQFIEVSGIKGEVSETQIIDLNGHSNAITFQRNGETLRANVAHLSTGIYVLQIREGNTIHKMKMIKK